MMKLEMVPLELLVNRVISLYSFYCFLAENALMHIACENTYVVLQTMSYLVFKTVIPTMLVRARL